MRAQVSATFVFGKVHRIKSYSGHAASSHEHQVVAEHQGNADKAEGATEQATSSHVAKPDPDVAKDAQQLAAVRAKREAISLGPPPAPRDGFHLFDRNYCLG